MSPKVAISHKILGNLWREIDFIKDVIGSTATKIGVIAWRILQFIDDIISLYCLFGKPAPFQLVAGFHLALGVQGEAEEAAGDG